MQNIMKIAYEGIMILLVMLTIITLWTDSAYNSTINWIIWIVFFVDFFVRLVTSKKKWTFIKQNPFLVIAIIPFDQFFQIARIVRVIHLFRIKTITKYYVFPYIEKITYQSMIWIISIIAALLVAESVLIWQFESSIPTYADAWGVLLSHLMFVGHQLFVIENPVVIWALTGTSILGIVIQGLALQWVFTKIESIVKDMSKKRV
ncbi:transporter [Virgibacillus sp. FSP13]